MGAVKNYYHDYLSEDREYDEWLTQRELEAQQAMDKDDEYIREIENTLPAEPGSLESGRDEQGKD